MPAFNRLDFTNLQLNVIFYFDENCVTLKYIMYLSHKNVGVNLATYLSTNYYFQQKK